VVTSPGEIGVVLPARESFTLRKSGAIALCARDFAAHSRFREAITILGAGPCEYDGTRYVRLEGWRRWWRRQSAAYADAVIRAARASGHALLEVQNRPYMIPALRRGLPGVRLALHLHNDPRDMKGARTPGERAALLAQIDAVYCVSQFARRCLLDGVADPEGKAIVIHNGVATPGERAPKAPIFAFVGRVIAVKGVVELVKAFAEAAPDLPRWRLVIAGDDPEGLLTGPRSVVARQREALGGRLTLLGQVSHAEAMALYSRAEVAVVPSLWEEPLSRSAIEAMAHGCALIATARGGLAEVVENAGEIIDATDIAGFADALRRVGTDAARREALRGRGMAKARDMFEISRVTATLDVARDRLLSRDAGGQS
jgi:UDP-glucose:(glucosyl)LPS alpha-1,2-glucosyltransferase